MFGVVIHHQNRLVAGLMRGDTSRAIADKGLNVDECRTGRLFERGLHRNDGQREGEYAAMAGLALHPDPPAMVLDNLFADRQAESCAFGLVGQGIAHLLEFFEDFGLIGSGNADARVDDAYDHSPSICSGQST